MNGEDGYLFRPEIDRISGYGISMMRMQRSHIQMLRSWRNDPSVSVNMGTQQYITAEDQEKWFERCKTRDDAFYFIAYFNDEMFGYMCIQNIDWSMMCGDPGIIMRPDKNTGTLALNATLCMNDFLFDDLGLEYLSTSILDHNKRAIRFDTLIGYVPIDGTSNGKDPKYILTRKRYHQNRSIIIDMLALDV